MAQSEVRNRSKVKRKANYSELYLKNYGNKNDLNAWKAGHICSGLRRVIPFSGFITYESVFTEEKISDVKEFVIMSTLAGVVVSQWIFLIITMVNELRKDFHSVMSFLPFVLTGGVLVVKAIVFYFRKKQMQQFYRSLAQLWDQQLRYGLDEEVVTNIKRTIHLVRTCVCIALTAAIFFTLRPLYPVLDRIINEKSGSYFNEKVLPTKYPFAMDSLPKYIFCNLWETYTVVYACLSWYSSDVAFIIPSAVISFMLQILGIEFRNAVPSSHITGPDRRFRRRLCKVARKHSSLLKYCRKLDTLFSPIILAVLVYAALSLSLCMINIREQWSNGNVVGAVVYALNAMGIVLQIALYCNCTDNISHWTANIAQEVYNCNWTSCSIKFRKLMLMIMMRAQKNYIFKAYGFYVVDRRQLTKIIILTYNMFTAINAAKAVEYG